MVCYYMHIPSKTVMMNCYYMHIPSKTVMMMFLRLCSIPSASLSILLYLHSALVRLLLANAIGQTMVLSGVLSFGHDVPSLVWSSAAPSPIPEASVSR